MVCDTLGRPLRFMLTAGQCHDSLTAKAVLADKAYDNNDLRQAIAEMEAEAVIPFNPLAQDPHPARRGGL
jgi:transposase